MAGMKFGLNLYSLREQISTKEDFLKTATKLKELGYDYLQYSGGPWEPEWIREVSEEVGMPVVITHVKLPQMLEDPAKIVAEHRHFGCNNVGLGGFNSRSLPEEEILQGIRDIHRAAKELTAEGAKFFYHNHHFDFQKLSDGRTIFEAIIECPEVNVILDTFWLQAGGVAILEYIDKLKGRIGCVHLKDYLPTFEGKAFTPQFMPVGDGHINWHAVIPAFLKAGAEYFFVEQDNATKCDDPFEQVGRSIKYLKENF